MHTAARRHAVEVVERPVAEGGERDVAGREYASGFAERHATGKAHAGGKNHSYGAEKGPAALEATIERGVEVWYAAAGANPTDDVHLIPRPNHLKVLGGSLGCRAI